MGPPLPFDQTGAAPVLQLDRLPARYSLPQGNLPSDFGTLGRFPVTGLTDTGQLEGELRCYAVELPFSVSQRQGFRFAPTGMAVFVGGAEVAYETQPCGSDRGRHWSLRENRLFVVWPEAPASVTIKHEGLQERIERLEYGSAGLTPYAFVRHSLTIDDQTRQGVLLPAPATAEWDVTVPEGGRFSAWMAMVRPPLDAVRSDGAAVALSVIVDGAETRIGRREISGAPSFLGRLIGFDGGFERWTLDLSRWSGEQVTLRISTEPGATADWDYVFVGTPEVVGVPTGQTRRVVVIALDTTRPDHLGTHGYHRDTSPELDAFAATSAVFDRAWAPAPRTRPSFRSATTGRDPLDAVGATNIGEVFDRSGFATAGIVANVHLNTRFDFDDGFDFWLLDTQARADQQVDRAISWLTENRGRDSYLFLHIMDPHLFYFAPAPYGQRWVTDPDPDLPSVFNRWEVLRWAASGELDDRRKEHIKALYDGEIAYTSAQVGRFIRALDALGGKNLVVLHSDHGEELWEHGGFEHNHTLYDETVRAALWVRPPEPIPAGGVRIDTPATLSDIAPTLFDYAGIQEVPPTDGRSLRPLIEGHASDGWDRPIGIGHLMYDRERWGVIVDGQFKYIVQTWTGDEELYDLHADPGEQRNLAPSTDTSPYWRALSLAHRMAVGPGWRVDVELRRPSVKIHLPERALAAGVIDPEAGSVTRANLAWGESPRVALPSEIATVTLSDDGRTVEVERGREPNARIYVLFAAPVEAAFTLTPSAATARPDPLRPIASASGVKVDVSPGVIVVPPPGEAARMGLIEAGGGDEMELLEALGYIGGH